MAASSVSDFSSHKKRFETYTLQTGDEESKLTAMARSAAGFIQSPTDVTAVVCPWCTMELRSFHDSHSPLAWHRTFSSQCPFVKNNAAVNKLDMGVSFPDQVDTPFDLTRVLPGTVNEPHTSSMEFESNSSTGGHLTLQSHHGGELDEIDGDTGPAGLEETNKLYKKNAQLRRILPGEDIARIKRKPDGTRAMLAIHREVERLKTFAAWPKNDTIPAKELARAGFVYCGTLENVPITDMVECVYCKVRVSGWAAGTDPYKKHVEKSPGCAFIQGLPTAPNVPDIVPELFDAEEQANSSTPNRQISLELGIITDTTKYPEFAVPTRREASFTTWPVTNKKLAAEMIEHHMFYKGVGDTVCCFSCGVEMSDWTENQNIWVRHAQQSPTCQLLIREKGQDFITSTIQEHGNYRTPEREPAIHVVTTRMLRPRMDSTVTQTVLRLPDIYPREDVKQALIDNIKYGGRDFRYAADLVSAVLDKKQERNELDRVQRQFQEAPRPPEILHAPEARNPAVEAVEADSTLPSQAAANGTAAGDDEAATTTSRQRSPSPPIENISELAKQVKTQLACKICMDAPVGIVFLPCGHLVCCPACAPAMLHCPLCRQDVKGTIRANLDKL